MNNNRQIRFLLSAFIALVIISAPVLGQMGSGSIHGSITSIDGTPIPRARILLTRAASGQTFAVRSSADGGFDLGNLPDGVFIVAIEAPGFNSVSNRKVVVRGSKPAELQEVLDKASPSAETPEDVAALRLRIDGLEAQNRELANQNRAIMQAIADLKARLDSPGELAHASLTKPSANAQGDPDFAPSPTAAARADPTPAASRPGSHSGETAAAGKSSASGSADKGQSGRWSEAISEGNQFKLYGSLRLDMIVDSQRPNNAQSPLFIPSPDSLAGGKPGAGSFTMHPRLTTFGIDYNGPQISALGDGRISGKLEADFQNGGPEFASVIRILQAYFKIQWGDFWILGGQKWDTFSPMRPIVNDDSIMLATGNLGLRRPQFLAGYEPKVGNGQFSFVGGIGLTGAVNGQDLDGNGFRDGEKSGRPNVQARVGYSHPLWVKDQSATIGVSGIYGWLNTDSPVAGRTGFREQLINIDYVLPIARFVSVRGEGWWGRNLSDLVGGIGQGINLITGQEIRSRGGWSELNFKLSRFYSFNPGFTTDDPVDQDIPDGGRTRNHAFYVGNRIMPSENFLIGIDYLRWTTTFKGFERGLDNRVNIFFAYHF